MSEAALGDRTRATSIANATPLSGMSSINDIFFPSITINMGMINASR